MNPNLKQIPVINIQKTGARLKQLASERELSAKELSEMLGFTSEAAVYKWFNGSSLPSKDNLLILQQVFELDSINQMLVVDMVDIGS